MKITKAQRVVFFFFNVNSLSTLANFFITIIS